MWKLNVYNDDGSIKKTVEAKELDLRVKTIVKLAKIINFEQLKSVTELSGIILTQCDKIGEALNLFFPDMSDDDWENCKIDELIPIIIDIGQFAVKKTYGIPQDNNSKN